MAGAVQGETVMQLINFVAAGQWQAIKSATAASCEPLSATLSDRATLTARQKPTDSAIFGKAVWLSLRKIKRAAKPPISRPTFAAHFILPKRTSATRQFCAKQTNFLLTFAPWKKFWHSYSVSTCWLWQLCLAATRRTVNIRVPTNPLSQQQTTQTTTATPNIAHLFVCVLAADRLLVVRLLIAV